MSGFLTAAVEGKVDQAVLERILVDFDITLAAVHGFKGKGHLEKNIRGYNKAAERSHWTVLMDLNHEADCAAFVRRCLPEPAEFMCFQLAIREIEAWLIADASQFARYLGVPVSGIPTEPETLPDPKRAVIDLARQSKRTDIRKALVPRDKSGRAVGPAYERFMQDFAGTRWRPEKAELQSPSLKRFRRRLRDLQGIGV